MTDADDPIRRGDVEALIRMEFPCRCADLPETNDGLPNDDVPCDGCFSSMALRAHLRALPADPVAETSVRLAELLMSDLDERESMGPAAWDAALTAVRAAVAARAKLKEATP